MESKRVNYEQKIAIRRKRVAGACLIFAGVVNVLGMIDTLSSLGVTALLVLASVALAYRRRWTEKFAISIALLAIGYSMVNAYLLYYVLPSVIYETRHMVVTPRALLEAGLIFIIPSNILCIIAMIYILRARRVMKT